MAIADAGAHDHQARYRRHINHRLLLLAGLCVLLLAAAVVSITVGSSGLGLVEVAEALAGGGTAKARAIVWTLRLPRIATAAVVGCALALSGCVMQCVLQNPLASASTLGVSQGASFGATVAIVCLSAGVQQSNATASGAVAITDPYLVTVCAFAGGMLTVAVILALSRLASVGASALVLAGVALSALFMGGATLVQYFADDVAIASVVFWTFGDLGRTSTTETGIVLVVLAVAAAYFYAHSWSYNALQSGEASALSLGTNVHRLALASMTLAALLAATAVAFVGIINFVGLVAPHMIRRFSGGDFRFFLPASGLTGACVLVLADIAARMAAAPAVLPIGSITSFLGAPLFLYLIFRGSKQC